MTGPDAPGEALTAALIQISSHAERIASLDAREAGHYREIAARLDSLDHQVAALATRLAARTSADDENDADGQRYHAVPAPRWWNLTGPEREAAIDRLRAWVDQVYRPSYGQLAAILPDCWEDHPPCLYTLDWLSELWSVLYLGTGRTDRVLAAQAEWQLRLLPNAADQMAAEADGCQHRPGPRQPLASRTPAGRR